MNKKLLIMIGLISLIVLIVFITGIYSYSNRTKSIWESEIIGIGDCYQTGKIDVSLEINKKKKEFVLTFTNYTNTDYVMTYTVTFYDENDKKLGERGRYSFNEYIFGVNAKSSSIDKRPFTYGDNNIRVDEIKKYKIKINLTKASEIEGLIF